MRENAAKRNYLPMGTYQKIDPTTIPGVIKTTHPTTGKTEVGGWCKHGDYMIYLGVPIGNGFSTEEFLLCIYKKAKAKLSSVRSITAIGLVGKHRLLNANFFGMFRYTMFSLLPEELITKYILSDAKKFLWKRDPELSADELDRHNREVDQHDSHF